MSIYEQIDDLPGEGGFWKASSREAFYTAAAKLILLGMSEAEATEFLSGLFNAVRAEYGD